MRRITLVATCLLLMVVPVRAQDDYRLRVPTAAEFLDTALTPFDWINHNEVPQFDSSVLSAIDTTFFARYADDIDFETAYEIYQRLDLKLGHVGFSTLKLDWNLWQDYLIERWINEHQIDLDRMDTISFEAFTIRVEPRDFDGDGVHEWLLDVSKQQRDSTTPLIWYQIVYRSGETHHVVSAPVVADTHWGGGLEEFAFEDINADGKLEWGLVDHGSLYIGGGYISASTRIYLGQWTGTSFHIILSAAGSNRMELANIDVDPAQELIVSEDNVDNWECVTRHSLSYDWDGNAYVPGVPETQFLDSVGCMLRRAEEAMWIGDFQTAAALYEPYLVEYERVYAEYLIELKKCDCRTHVRNLLLGPYVYARQIIAHAMMRDNERVQQDLDALKADDRRDEFGDALIAANSNRAEDLCQAAYDHYQANSALYISSEWEIQNRVLPGMVLENVHVLMPSYFLGSTIDPARAGCDPAFLNPAYHPTPTPTPTPFVSHYTPDRNYEALEDARELEQKLLRDGDYGQVVEVATNVLEQFTSDAYAYALFEIRYYRALALERMNRPSEALDDYVTIYENAPGAAWRLLAGLNFERTTTRTN